MKHVSRRLTLGTAFSILTSYPLFYLLGDYGKLGLGNNTTQKSPKLILGPLNGKVSGLAVFNY
jgi:hypothetical protein